MLLLISNSETVKCLQKVAENLIFLFSPIYFTVGFGRHIVIRIVSAILSHISGNGTYGTDCLPTVSALYLMRTK